MRICASQAGARPWHPADYASPLCRRGFAPVPRGAFSAELSQP